MAWLKAHSSLSSLGWQRLRSRALSRNFFVNLKMSMLKLLATASAFFIFSGCVKDPVVTPVIVPPASVAFDFVATANNKPLVRDSVWYTNPGKDSFTVSTFNYYISNIKFRRADGFVFSEPDSYRINRHANGPCSFTVSGLPDGIYDTVEFSIGVDSVRNSGGAQTGALGVEQGMYWDWNTGYVFFKLEGNFKTLRTPVPDLFAMHIGTNANLQNCSMSLGASTINARKGKQSAIHYTVNVDEIFANPVNLDFNTYHAVSGGPLAAVISKNYKDMFSVSAVEN
jgi:hypothetical protein